MILGDEVVERAYFRDLAAHAGCDTIALDAAEAHHLGRVRRGRAGDRVLVFDGTGHARWAVVAEVGRRAVSLRLTDPPVAPPPVATPVDVCVAPPKAKRMRWLLEKATELGARAIVPLVCARTVADATARGEQKRGKWRQVTIEAAKQSGQTILPEIREAAALDDALALPADLRCVLDPRAPSPLASVLGEARAARSVASIAVLIGPEGGFTEDEVGRARAAGAIPARVAPAILRVETAAIAALASVRAMGL